MIAFLRSPKAVILAFFMVGIIVSFFPDIAAYLQKPGEMYLTLLQMCIMPLLMMSIIKAISSVVSLTSQAKTTRKFLVVYLSVAMGLSLITVFVANLGQLGYSISENPKFIELASSNAQSQTHWVDIQDPLDQSNSLIDILKSIFTHNIFASLKDALILQVLFFSCFVGAAAGFLRDQQKEIFFALIGASDAIFKKIISWIMLFLPLGIICIFSIKFVMLPFEIMQVLFKVILYFIAVVMGMVGLLNIYVSYKLQQSYFRVLYDFGLVLTISASTGSPIATMPTYMQTLSENFNFNKT
ncbi:MAG: cation:dicarboxylase symporter family transporter, partial [Alphaproteobacteria bacterium]|nr:cation:dicarboxylase symporter family transporter [Alphaproteobacteria bacterium]